MADQKISELTQIVAANIAATDELAIVDSSVPRTKKVTASDLADYVLRRQFTDFADLDANAKTYAAGTILSTEKEGFAYECVVSGGDITLTGGQQVENVPVDGVYKAAAFDSNAQTFMPLLGDDVVVSGHHIQSGSDDLFNLQGEAAILSGFQLRDFSARGITGNGLIVGSRASTTDARTEQQSRTGLTIDNVSVNDIGDITGSTYGMAVVATNSRITNFDVTDLNFSTSDDSEGFYLKCQDSFVWGGRIADSGDDAMAVKGKQSGDTSGPNGFGNLIGGIQFYASATFNASNSASKKKGLRIECGGNTFKSLRFDGFNAEAWYTTNESNSGFTISDVEVLGCGQSGRGAVYARCFGGTYRIRDHYIHNATADGIEISGQTSASTFIVEDAVIEGAGNNAFNLQPTTDDVLTVEIVGGQTITAGGDFINMATERLKKLRVENHAISGISGSIVDANTVPHEIIWKNSPITAQTTDATNTTVLTLPVPTDGSANLKVKVTGSQAGSGEVFYQSFEAAFTNSSGTATEEGENAGTAIKSSGASAWSAVVNAIGGNARVRVTGAAATTINWTVDAEFIGNS